MDALHGLHPRFVRRQGLGGVVGGLLGGGNSPTPSSASNGVKTSGSQNPEDPLGLGGVVGGLTSLVGGVPTILVPPSGSSSAAPSSTPLTRSSSSSTGSTTIATSASSTPITSSVRSSTTASSTPASTSTPSSTPTPTPSPTLSDNVYQTTSGDSIVYITSTAHVPSATAAPPKSFLQNPPLEGGVFALVGIVALIIIFAVVTWTMRKRRRDRLDREIADAVTFDPSMTERYEDDRMGSMEKRRLSGSSSGHGHGGYGYGAQPAYAAPQLAPQQGYYGQAAYGQYPAAAYRAPSPNPHAPYRAPSPAAPPQAAGYGYNNNIGGANLTRKYSDRKPVPPLLPDPVYDPSHTQVALPQQYYGYGQEQPLPPAPMRSSSPVPGSNAAPALPATFGEPNPEVLKIANQ